MEKAESVNVEQICENGAALRKLGSDEMWPQDVITAVARDGDEEEKTMTIRQALKHYKKAICWSLAISLCVIMEGYDTNLISNFYAYREATLVSFNNRNLIQLTSL